MRALVLALALLAARPALAAKSACAASLHPVRTAELFFGQAAEGRLLADTQWKAFVDEEMTPRFPDGLTVLDAYGQWRRPDGPISREQSKVVLIVLPGRSDDQARLDSLIDAYKARFHQLSVLLVEHRECARF
jgi:hypothetical protein